MKMKKTMCMLTALLMALTLLCGPAAVPAARAEEEYTLPREEGTRYYRVSIVVNNNGVSSEPFYSAIVPVTPLYVPRNLTL